jgi:hypothetical protein
MATGTDQAERQAVAQVQVKPCETPSTTSTATLPSVVQRLDSDSQTNLEAVVTVAQATAILDAMTGRDHHCDAETAATLARNLVGMYPAREVHDAKAYAAGMTAVLMAHPADFVRRVCDPARGLPSRLKWLPTLADVTEAITAERNRRERIASNARYVIAHHDARKREAEEQAEFEANRPSAEDRARQVAEAMARLKAMPIAEPPKVSQPGWKPSPELMADLDRRKAVRLAEQQAAE